MTAPSDYVAVQREHNIRDEGNVYNLFVQERARECLHYLKKDKVTSILDVGCRNGYALAVFEERLPSARVVGIDIVPEFVEQARQVCNEVYEGDAHTLPFGDKEFDVVFSSHTLEHCYDPPKAMAEVKRVARVSAFLVLPLEQHDPLNPSHFFNTVDPLEWARMACDDEWSLLSLDVNDRGDVRLIIVRGPVYAVHSKGAKRG